MSLVKCKIGPSILNSDLSDLANVSQKLLEAGADYLHLDVMDGHFVPNITFGHPLIKCMKTKLSHTFMEAHMMVSDPNQWIEPMADAGVDQYTFHIEASDDGFETCRKIRDAGMGVGIGIKPNTDVTVVDEYIEIVDTILIMTVEPGFGGQKFMANMLGKVKYLRENYPGLDIEVDGGVGPDTITKCAQAGANMIVSGSAVTGSDNPRKVITELREAVNAVLLGDNS